MAFAIGKYIYVAGGVEYDLKSPRSKIIEQYDEKMNSWEEINLKLPIGLEGACCLLKYSKDYPLELFIFGGRSDDNDEDMIFLISIDDESKGLNVGQDQAF